MSPRFTDIVSARMSSLDFTRSLAEPKSISGECHCGEKNVLLNANYVQREDNKGVKKSGEHCWLCRCDEHTPQAHALWSADQRRGRDPSSASTQLPGCGRRCDRGDVDTLLAPEFPTFEEWVRTNGCAALRKAAKS